MASESHVKERFARWVCHQTCNQVEVEILLEVASVLLVLAMIEVGLILDS